jgi:hypothetical protein
MKKTFHSDRLLAVSRVRGLLLVAIACAACGNSIRPGGTNDAHGVSGDGRGTGGGDSSGSPGTASIFAHTATTLYTVDPDSYAVTRIGDFDFDASEQMTDLGIDATGNLVGVSFFSVYKVDPVTAHCTQLSSSISRSFNGLSFVPAAAVGTTGADVLVGTEDLDDLVFKVNPTTGAATRIGAMGGGYSSSGDIVSVDGFGTVQTVPGSPHDVLVRLAPSTFAATPIGTDTGFDNIWGLGFWKGKVFGFTNAGELITLDPHTGVGTMVASGGPAWFGAAVTTTAPVIP